MKKLFTTSDLIEITGMTKQGVSNRIKRFNILPTHFEYRKTSQGNTVKEFAFTEEEVCLMGFFDFMQTKEKKSNKTEPTLEELQKAHPLIKDPRMFKLSFFPDVIPDIYKENEGFLND